MGLGGNVTKTRGEETDHLSNHNFLITLESGGCLFQDGRQLLAVSTPGGIEFNKNCNTIRYIKITSNLLYEDFHHWDKDTNYMLNRIKDCYRMSRLVIYYIKNPIAGTKNYIHAKHHSVEITPTINNT